MKRFESRLAQLCTQIHEDWVTHQRDWTRPGFRAVAVHRFGVWSQGLHSRLLRAAGVRLYRILFRYIRNHYGIELPGSTIVGRRFWIAHQGGIVIHPKAEIGDDCLIRQNVTIGAASHDRPREAPKLGNGVQVGSGAAILGNVKIGDGVRIGPNAVVMTSVPAGVIVFAAPARILRLPQPKEASGEEKTTGSFECSVDGGLSAKGSSQWTKS